MATGPNGERIHFEITGQGICKDIGLFNGDDRVCGVAEVFPLSEPEAERLIGLANAAIAHGLSVVKVGTEPAGTPGSGQ